MGWIVLFIGSTFILTFIAFSAYPFLSVSKPCNSDVLVVEGWLNLGGFKAAAREAKARSCTFVFTTGGPVIGSGPYTSDFDTVAHSAYSALVVAGLPEDVLVKVPCRVRGRERTYSAGLALRRWFDEHNFSPTSLNVLTEGTHARRTRFLFQKALGPNTNVGIISVPSDEYPSQRWWKYSQGVKDVLTEGIAYLYVRLCFWPASTDE